MDKTTDMVFRLIYLFYFLSLMLIPGISDIAFAGNKKVKQLMREVTPLSGVTPAQWRLIWKEDPATTATISWSTAKEGIRHRVYYDTLSHVRDLPSYASKTKAYRNGRYTFKRGEIGSFPSAYYHHVLLTGLKPSTTYYFAIASDHEVSREFHFTTAPADDRDFSVLFGGDSRSGHETRSAINLLIANYAENDPNLLALAHGGDYVLDGKKWKDWVRWLSHHELMVSASGRMLPIIPTRGNHDDGPLFNEIFDAPGVDGKNYFNSRLSATVSLVTLNTEISTGGDQRNWLKTQLEVLRPNSRWMLAQYHRPLYPAIKGPAAAKPHWVPLFEKYNMDLVYEADGHTIKRTLPIRNDRPDPTGVVYVGEGGLGVRQRSPKKNRWYLQKPGFTAKGHHLVRVDFTSSAMEYTVIMEDETIKDQYTFTPRSHPNTGLDDGEVSEF